MCFPDNLSRMIFTARMFFYTSFFLLFARLIVLNDQLYLFIDTTCKNVSNFWMTNFLYRYIFSFSNIIGNGFVVEIFYTIGMTLFGY